jgi:hypothetical protein
VRAYDNTASALSPAISSQLLEVLLALLDESIRATYSTSLLRFHQFCNQQKVGKVSGKTVGNWLSRVHAWHKINLAPWLGGETLSSVQHAVAKLMPSTFVREKRPPATLRHIGALFAGLDLTNSRNAVIMAAASFTFWGCCRLGKLLVPIISRVSNADKFVWRSTKEPLTSAFCTTESSIAYFHFHIPWTKTTAEDGADISIVRRAGNLLCLLVAICHHIKANASVPANAPLFTFETADGWSPLTKEAFMQRCNNVVVAAGLPPIFGHSFRIGGATELLLMGTELDVVRVQGRWMSDSFLEYWRKIDEILPLFLAHAQGKERVAVLRKATKPYIARRTESAL